MHDISSMRYIHTHTLVEMSKQTLPQQNKLVDAVIVIAERH